MAETVKKTPASKPRKAPAKKAASNVESIENNETFQKNGSAPKSASSPKSVAGSKHGAGPSHDQIAELARKYWAERGYKDGHHEEDWLRAEQELRGKAS